VSLAKPLPPAPDEDHSAGGPGSGGAGAPAAVGAETEGPNLDDQDEALFRENFNAEKDALEAGKTDAAALAVKSQEAVLKRMLERKAKLDGCPALKKPLEQFSTQQRLSLFQRLYDLADPKEPAFA